MWQKLKEWLRKLVAGPLPDNLFALGIILSLVLVGM